MSRWRVEDRRLKILFLPLSVIDLAEIGMLVDLAGVEGQLGDSLVNRAKAV